MALNKKDIQSLAELAKLNLSDQEVKDYTRQLDKVLAYFGKIKKLKLDKVKSSLSGAEDLPSVWRPDQAKASDNQLIKQAAKLEGGYLVAPNVFKK